MLKDTGNTDPLCRLDRVIMRRGGTWRARSIHLLGTCAIGAVQLPPPPGETGGARQVEIFASDHFGLVAVVGREGCG